MSVSLAIYSAFLMNIITLDCSELFKIVMKLTIKKIVNTPNLKLYGFLLISATV